VTLATGWTATAIQVLGPKSDALIWYSVWDDRQRRAGLGRATACVGDTTAGGRRAGAGGAEIKQLTIQGLPCVRLVVRPPLERCWRAIPTVRLSATGG